MMATEPDERLLARNMIDVHGAEAAAVARSNARGAALARQPVQAKSWIRVLGLIQQHRAPSLSPNRATRDLSSALPGEAGRGFGSLACPISQLKMLN
jgi:hypothetical protein